MSMFCTCVFAYKPIIDFFIIWQQFFLIVLSKQVSSKNVHILVHLPIYGGHLLYTTFRKKNSGTNIQTVLVFFFFNGNSVKCFTFECSNKPSFNFGRLTMVKSYERNINFTSPDRYMVGDIWFYENPCLKCTS